MNFITEEDRFKFIDDLSLLEIINLISLGLSSYNCRLHVPSDINIEHNHYLPPQNIHTPNYLDDIKEWTDDHLMKVNPGKSKFMVVNFTENYQFSTRLLLDGKLMENVSETRLLGVTISDDLTWQTNTDLIIKQAYKRMILLQRLYSFRLPIEEMVEIYTLYIRSILESSAVVWHSSITQAEQTLIERVKQKSSCSQIIRVMIVLLS